jgi:hypothetical protein
MASGRVTIPADEWIGSAFLLAQPASWPLDVLLPNGTTMTVGEAHWRKADCLTHDGTRRLILMAAGAEACFYFPGQNLPASGNDTLALERGEWLLCRYCQLLVDTMTEGKNKEPLLWECYSADLLADTAQATTLRQLAVLLFLVVVLRSNDITTRWLDAEQQLAQWAARRRIHASYETLAQVAAAAAKSDVAERLGALEAGAMYAAFSECVRRGDPAAIASMHRATLHDMAQRLVLAAPAARPRCPQLEALGAALASALATDPMIPLVFHKRVGVPGELTMAALHADAGAAQARPMTMWAPGQGQWRAPWSDAERRARAARAVCDLEDLVTDGEGARARLPPCWRKLMAAGGLRDPERFAVATWLRAMRPDGTPGDAAEALRFVQLVKPLAPDSRATFAEKFLMDEAMTKLPGCQYVFKKGTNGRLECPFRDQSLADAQSACSALCSGSGGDIRHPIDFVLRTMRY